MSGEILPIKSRNHAAEAELLRKLKRYLILREDGVLLHAALRQVGLTFEELKRERSRNPQFVEAEKVSTAAGVELVEEQLQAKALKGDYQAMSKFLEANDERYAPKRGSDHHTVLVVPVNAGNALDRIAQLREELERRRNDMPEQFLGKNPFVRDPAERRDEYEADEDIVEAEVVDDA